MWFFSGKCTPTSRLAHKKMLSGWCLYIIQLLLNCYKGWSLCRKWMHLLGVPGSKPGTSSSCPFLLLLLSVNKSQGLTVNKSGHGYTHNYPYSSATALFRINFIFRIYFCLWASLLSWFRQRKILQKNWELPIVVMPFFLTEWLNKFIHSICVFLPFITCIYYNYSLDTNFFNF